MGGAKRRFPAEFVKRSQFLGLEVVETLRQDFSNQEQVKASGS